MKKLLVGLFVFASFSLNIFTVRAENNIALPDLVITDFTWSPVDPVVTKPIGYLNFNVTIKNIGNASIKLPEDMHLTLYKNEIGVGGFALGTAVYVLNPGDSQVFNFKTTQSPNILEEAGPYNLKMKVDSDYYSIDTNNGGLVKESNENNNVLTKNIIVYLTSGVKTPSVFVLSPNGGDVFTQNAENKISFSFYNISNNRNQFAQFALVDSRATNFSDVSKYIKGWIATENETSITGGSIIWDAMKVCDLTYTQCSYVQPGQYKILAQIKDLNGNLVLDPSSDSWDLSDNVFTIVSSVDTGCSNYEVYSSTTGQLCQNNRDAYVKLTYPLSGSTFNVGQSVQVKIDSNLTRQGAFRAQIYRKNSYGSYVFLKNFDTANSGVQTIQIPYWTPVGEYKIEYGHTFGYGDYTKYGTSIFYVISNSDGCSNGQVYSSTTGERCKADIISCPPNMPNPYSLCPDGKIEPNAYDYKGCVTSYKCSNVVVDNGCKGTMYSTTTGKLCGTCSSSGAGCYNSNITNATKITRTLRQGLIGEDVKRLQEFLGIGADGVFGRGTASSVKEWQVKNGLVGDGLFGYQSRIKANLNN